MEVALINDLGLLPFGSIPSGGSESKEGWAAHATLLDVGMAPIPPTKSLEERRGKYLGEQGRSLLHLFPMSDPTPDQDDFIHSEEFLHGLMRRQSSASSFRVLSCVPPPALRSPADLIIIFPPLWGSGSRLHFDLAHPRCPLFPLCMDYREDFQSLAP